MEIRFQSQGPESWGAEALLAFAFEEDELSKDCPWLLKACPWLAASPALKDFRGKKDEEALCYAPADSAIQRVLLRGLGKRGGLSLAVLRDATGMGMRKARSLGLKSVIIPEPALARLPGGRERLLQESVFAALISLYRFTELKTKTEGLAPDPEWLALGFDGAPSDADQNAVRRGEADAWALGLARDLDNLPGNLLYPELLALKAANLAHENGFSCSILSDNGLYEAGMGCMLAVGSGSVHPPRLIILEYAPEGHENDKPLLFIGKGLTFDSGGLCLKPAQNMYQMKCDMSGAAACLAAITALAREKAPRRLVCLLACAENMPSGSAYRPGDILISASGMSVEVINTDAEGRLVLCDAIAYAQKRWTPAAMVDIATLTGACAVALGKNIAGLFCDDAAFAERVSNIGAVSGENFWRLPLWEPYEKDLKSQIADIAHTASREGGAITSALFLKSFVESGLPWAHLDIAGVDWMDKDSPLCPVGATGFGTRSLLELARGGLE